MTTTVNNEGMKRKTKAELASLFLRVCAMTLQVNKFLTVMQWGSVTPQRVLTCSARPLIVYNSLNYSMDYPILVSPLSGEAMSKEHYLRSPKSVFSL